MLNNALFYHSLGWKVIPVLGKKPLFNNWQKEPTTETRINEWYKNNQKPLNIGIQTGAISNLIVVDIDTQNGYDLFTEMFPDSYPTVKTGGGGLHYYYSCPSDIDVPNAVRILDGVDIRGKNGLIVVPPSVHDSGNAYEWLNLEIDLTKLPTLPSEIVQLLKSKTMEPADWQVDIEKGQRDAELTRRAGKLFRAGLSETEVLPMLNQWNLTHCKPPLPLNQVKKITQSIAKRQSTNQTPEDYFKIYDFENTLAKYGEKEERWIIENWLPQATCGLIVAPPANYKTWLLLDLAVSVSTGKMFLGKYAVTKPGPVLIIQQEDPFPMLFTRIGTVMNIGQPLEQNDEYIVPKAPPFPHIYWHTDRLLNFENTRSIEGLEKAIEKIRPALVIIDPLYSVISSKDYMAEGAQSMLVLKRLRDDYGCSFMIAHHTVKKGGESGSREGLWGSQFLNAWLETGWQIRPAKNESTIKIKRHFKSSGIPTILKITFNIDKWCFSVETSETDTLVDEQSDRSRRSS